MLSGIVGVIMGAMASTTLKKKFPRADPLICGAGLAICCIVFSFSLYIFAENYIIIALVLIFLGEVAINLNWSIVADILLVRKS